MEARCILNRSLVCPGDCDHHTSAAAATNIWNDQIRQLVADATGSTIEEVDKAEDDIWKNSGEAMTEIAINSMAMMKDGLKPHLCDHVLDGRIKLPGQDG